MSIFKKTGPLALVALGFVSGGTKQLLSLEAKAADTYNSQTGTYLYELEKISAEEQKLIEKALHEPTLDNEILENVVFSIEHGKIKILGRKRANQNGSDPHAGTNSPTSG